MAMRILKPQFDISNFFSHIANNPNRTLLLDYDGTLAPFCSGRNQALFYPGVLTALQTLLDAKHTRVVLVSGRATKDLLPLLQLTPQPEVWGSHGHERILANGQRRIDAPNLRNTADLALARAWIKTIGFNQYLEEKPYGIAVHWRDLPSTMIGTMRAKILGDWSASLLKNRLRLYEFDGGIELSIPGKDKGDAVKTILSEMGSGGLVVYLGDDVTDEDAFKAIKGKGWGILVRDKFRPTAADLWIRPPEELLEFLSLWHTSITN